MSTKIETTTGELPLHKKYYLKNKELIKLKSKKYYLKNKEQVKLKNKKYHSNNKEKINKKCREYYATNLTKYKEKYEQNKELYLSRNKKSNFKNKEKRIDYYKNYYKNNRIELLQKSKQYYIDNCEKCKSINRKYHKDNKQQFQRKYKTNIQYRLAFTLRTTLLILINKQKAVKQESAINLVGCTLTDLKKHLESLWLPGMNWNNHSSNGWHIDHIRPVNTFDLTDLEQQKQCFHYTNLRPLWAKDNLSRPKDGSDLLRFSS